MNQPIKKNKTYTNVLIAAAIAAAAIAGYFIISSSPDKSGTGNDNSNAGTDTGSNTGGENGNTQTGRPPKECLAKSTEFPFGNGAGYDDRDNAVCENAYVKNIQKYLNKLLKIRVAAWGPTLLTVDGKYGDKTESAVKLIFNNNGKVTKPMYDMMLVDLK